MADMLKFRKGLFADLPETKTAGTIYVTTDEQAMYVDISASQRVRVGDIIQKNSVRDVEPPYSTDALYYFIEENALLKWGPFGENKAMAWKQLNSVSDITANLTALTSRVTANETAISTLNGGDTVAGSVKNTVKSAVDTAKSDLQSQIDTEKGRIDALNTTVGGHSTSISNLTTQLSDAQTSITENSTAIAGVTNRVGALETTVGGETSGLVKDVADLTAVVGATATAGLRKDVTDNTASINNIKNTIIGNDDSTGLRKKIADVETKATNNETAINKLNGTGDGSVSKAVNDAKTALQADINAVDGKVDALSEGQVTTNKNEIASLKTRIGNAEDGIAGNTANISTNTSAISVLNGTGAGSVSKAVGDAKTELNGKIDTANGKITANEKAITALETRVTTAEGKITATETAIEKLNGADTVEGSVAYAVKQAKDALSAEIDADINAANAMNYMGAVATYAALPTSNVHIGDTYVVSTKFTQDDETYHAGDLLVATGIETNGVITTGLAWNHVKTGYIGEHEAKLSGANNSIKLTSHLQDDLGTVTFKSATGNAGGVVVNVTNNQVSIDFEWGTF